MTRRRPLPLAFATLMLLGSFALAGCARDNGDAAADLADAAEETAAPADATPAAPPPAAAAAGKPATAVQESAAAPAETGDDAPSKSDATLERLTQLPAQDQLPSGKWQVGKNYSPIVPAQPTAVGPGKVEVVEVFWYGCNHCYALDPYLESWKKNKPDYVEFVRLPVMWGPAHKSHARLFYTLQALGRDKDLHTKVFDTIHRGNNMLLGNDEESSFKAQLAFAKANGISEKEFTDTYYKSMWVDTKMRQAEELTKRYRVEGVPLMVVNGKYTTDVGAAGGHSQLIALLNDLSRFREATLISVFLLDAQGLHRRTNGLDEELPPEAVWIDLLEPTPEEEAKVEKFLRIEVPTREEMREIETSNRLYEENGALYMTATVVTKLDTDIPENSQITFILAGNRLITNRYVDPLPFRRYVAYAERHPAQCATGAAVLAGLLESTVNRIADVIERVGADLDAISVDVFTPTQRRRATRDFRAILDRVGQSGDLTGKARETLASLGRLLVFAQQATTSIFTPDVRARLRTISRDVTQMADHASFLGNKVNFILDATLGMINIDQNNILKIFSVVTVFLLPPSVIGAIFGMNFERIPLSAQPWGFWAAIGMMALSAVLPWLEFKRRGWL